VTATPEDAARRIDELADRMFHHDLATRPLYASQLGYTEYIAELPDLTPQGREERRGVLADIAEQAAAVSADDLDDERRITRHMLLRTTSDALLALDVRAVDYTVTPIPQTGLAASVIINFPKTVLRNGTDGQSYVERCRRVGGWLEEAAERLRQGAREGMHPVRRLVTNSINQIDGYLAAALEADPLLSVGDPRQGAVPGWRDRLVAEVRDGVRPALARYRDFLATEVLSTARDDDRPGLAHIDGGTEWYARLAAAHTTTDRSVEEIHRSGLDLVEQLTDEMCRLGSTVLGSGDFAEITRRLRTDTDLFFADSEDVMRSAQDALRRANDALPGWLGRLPAADCVVIPMTPFEVENGDLGHYQWPARDGSRPGTYWLNTYKPNTRPRFESQVLAFHESVPGHHTQLALSNELADQSAFRRHAHVTAFSEGWALYVERLADEMGLYTGDIDRLGMISFDFWRACRLVVDTGMHAMGWSRRRAVDYMVEHSALTRKNVANEVDRYIGWPGQALGYMIGRLEIRKLRAEAERRLGAHLVLRDFHSELIGHGSLPLSVLGEVTDRWIRGREIDAGMTPR
jgi:uncharacterized protein (DUF885 family)